MNLLAMISPFNSKGGNSGPSVILNYSTVVFKVPYCWTSTLCRATALGDRGW